MATLGEPWRMGCVLIATITTLAGCERKEQLIDIETPAGEVEVERDRDTGDVDVEVVPDEHPNEP